MPATATGKPLGAKMLRCTGARALNRPPAERSAACRIADSERRAFARPGDERTLDLVQSYRRPGNVRELQNVIERAVIVCETDTLVVDENWLPQEAVAPAPPVLPLGDAIVAREREMIQAALADTKGKVSGPSGAAARLGLPASTLESKLRALRIRKRLYKES